MTALTQLGQTLNQGQSRQFDEAIPPILLVTTFESELLGLSGLSLKETIAILK
jgi:hypothetical protein